MIKTVKVLTILALSSAVLSADSDGLKVYGVNSGKIDYKITGSGNMMGVKTKSDGTKTVQFNSYGAKTLTEERLTQETVVGGNVNFEKSHKITLMDGAVIYSVDLRHKRIIRMQNPAFTMMGAGGDKSVMQVGEEMLKSMGGKKTGTDEVLGYSCDVWEAMGTKQCIYKGLPLRVEADVMGIKNVEIATKIEFDISLSDSDFELPDFPIYDEYGEKIARDQLGSMDKNSEAELAQVGEDMAALKSSMTAAMKSAGVKPGQQPTQAQQAQMQDAMMASMLPRMKQEVLAEEKMMLFGKECLSGANTLKEANECNRKMDEMSGESSDPEDDFLDWSPKTKSETLGFIDQGLAGMECIKNATTMAQVKSCMPAD